jgi:hypothetical protein
MNLKILFAILFFSDYTNSEQLTQKNKIKYFKERKIFTSTVILKDDKVGCSKNFIKFSKELLMYKFNVPSEHVTFKCDTLVDHRGITYTKHYRMILV